MNVWKGMLFLGGYMSAAAVQAEALRERAGDPGTPKEVVRAFLEQVRAGRHPEQAPRYLAPTVVAHQVTAESPQDVTRTPQDYAEHVAAFRQAWGEFDFEVTELIAEGDRVYARWRQRGCHVGEVDGHAPTRKPVIELASAVYRVEDGRIVEYWIQVDRLGTEAQLLANEKTPAQALCD